MTLTIKSEYKFSYPTITSGTLLQYVSAAIHPEVNCWMILALTPDGDLVSVRREHVKVMNKLEVALK